MISCDCPTCTRHRERYTLCKPLLACFFAHPQHEEDSIVRSQGYQEYKSIERNSRANAILSLDALEHSSLQAYLICSIPFRNRFF